MIQKKLGKLTFQKQIVYQEQTYLEDPSTIKRLNEYDCFDCSGIRAKTYDKPIF